MANDNRLLVARGAHGNHPDTVMVYGEHNQIAAIIPIGSNGICRPRSAEQAKSEPWWFNGSPYGAQIIGRSWERHAEDQGVIGG